MFFDLHVHTEKYSTCSSLRPHDAVMAAIGLKLDGIMIVEHDIIWDEYEIEELKEDTKSHDLVILRGQEITAYDNGIIQGHILTVGFYGILREPLSAQEIIEIVHQEGGAAIAAHPFRSSCGLGNMVFDLDLDAIETLNARTSAPENKKAEEVQKEINLPSIGGSDAHTCGEVGKNLTFFEDIIVTEEDAVKRILEKECIALHFSDICEEWREDR